jgi:hypothetical protein
MYGLNVQKLTLPTDKLFSLFCFILRDYFFFFYLGYAVRNDVVRKFLISTNDYEIGMTLSYVDGYRIL